MKIKFLKKGLKVDGKYYPCWYSGSKNTKYGEHVTVYLKNYDRLPDALKSELDVKSDTEKQTDYIMKDRIIIPREHKYFNLVESMAV